jgi:glutaredoxin-related protein
MKRFLIKIFIISSSFIGINIVFFYFIKFTNLEFRKAEDISKFKGKDYTCIIIGNSLALDGFDTKFLTEKGISSYNFAVGGATLLTSLLQLERYLQFNSPPKVVLLGLRTRFLNNNLDSKVINPVIGYFYQDQGLTLESLPVVQFKWLATTAAKNLVSSEHRNAEMVFGQYRITRAVPDESKPKVQEDPLDYQTISSSMDLQRLTELSNKYKFEIVIFEMPLFRNLRNNRPEFDVIEIQGFAPIPVINVNRNEVVEGLFEPKTDWLGNSHLNVKGGRKFTEFIYDRYLFPVFSDSATNFITLSKKILN